MSKFDSPARPYAYAIVECPDAEDRLEADDDMPNLIYRPVVSRHRTFEAALRAYHRASRKTTRGPDGKRVREDPTYCRQYAVQAIDPK